MAEGPAAVTYSVSAALGVDDSELALRAAAVGRGEPGDRVLRRYPLAEEGEPLAGGERTGGGEIHVAILSHGQDRPASVTAAWGTTAGRRDRRG